MKKFLLTVATIAIFSSPAMAEEYIVKMVTDKDAKKVYYFEPEVLKIQPGDTVKWVMVQDDIHNAVADAGPKGAELFSSPMLEEKGQSWSYTFDGKEGTYSYHCHPHAAMGMKGKIIVGKASKPEEMEGSSGHGKHSHGEKMKMPMKHDMKDMKATMGHDMKEKKEHDHDESKKEDRKILYWVAPMDPNFRRDKPGKSPMGMDLVPVYEDDKGKEEKHGDDHSH